MPKTPDLNVFQTVVLGMFVIFISVGILVGALVFNKEYVNNTSTDYGYTALPIVPYWSDAVVKIDDEGVKIRHKPDQPWSVVFDHVTGPIVQDIANIQLNDSDSDLRVISDNIGNKFLPRTVREFEEHKHYLVLDDNFRIWHFYFRGRELIHRSFVTTFVSQNYESSGINLIGN